MDCDSCANATGGNSTHPLDEFVRILPPWAVCAMRVLDVWRRGIARELRCDVETVCPLPLVVKLGIAAPQTREEFDAVVASPGGWAAPCAHVHEVLRILHGARWCGNQSRRRSR